LIVSASLVNGSLMLDSDTKLLSAFFRIIPRRYLAAPIFRDPPYMERLFALRPQILGVPVNAPGDKWIWAWGGTADPPGNKPHPPDPPPSVQRCYTLQPGNESGLWCIGSDGMRGDLFTGGLVALYTAMSAGGSAGPVSLSISAA
jgi:hypothetical protein